MAQKHDTPTHAPGTALSPGVARSEPKVHPTIELPGVDRPSPANDASPRPKTPPRDARSPGEDAAPERPEAHDARRAPLATAETIAAPASPVAPISSDRLAQLAAHLPRVERDTYTAGQIVAKGGIGRVRSARDQRLDRPVALKELLVWNEAQEQRFFHEAILTARLQHPAIVPIYEAGRWPDGEPFYAMKLVSGRSLADLIGERKRLEDRLSLLPHVLTVAQAVAYAHGQRILHRDLKPANVLIGEFGETVVIDWGLAKSLGDKDLAGSATVAPMNGEGLTIEGAVVGTPAYMPPEQAAGEHVDERADVYALGAMLYHLLAAVPPYNDTPWEKLLPAIVEGPPRRIEALVPALSDDLCAIVNKAMTRDRAGRYQTAKDLADDLDRFLTGRIVAAHSYSTSALLRRFWRRNRAVISMAIGAMALLSLVIVYAFIKTDRERRFALEKQRDAEIAEGHAIDARAQAEAAGKKAVERADELTLLQAETALERDPNEALAWLKTLSPAFSDAGELRRIAADAQGRGISRAFRGHATHINLIIPVGDGRFLSTSDDKTLRLWDAKTGESRVFEGHTDEVWSAAISPDQKHVVSISKDSTARRWDVETGKLLARVDLPSPARQVLYLQGRVVGCTGSGPGAPWTWDDGAADVRFLTDRSISPKASALSSNGQWLAYRQEDDDIVFIDLRADTKPRRLGRHSTMDSHLTLSDNGAILVASDTWIAKPTKAVFWRTDTGEATTIPFAHPTGYVLASSSGSLIVSASSEITEVYDVGQKKVTKTFPGHGAGVYMAVLSTDATLLVTGGYDKTVRTLDLGTGERRAYAGLRGFVSSVALWPDANGRQVLASSSLGDIRLFEPGRAGEVLLRHAAPGSSLAVSRAGELASLDEKGTLRISDREGHPIAEHLLPISTHSSLAASPDSKHLVYGGVEPSPLGETKSPGRPALDGKSPPGHAHGFLWLGSFSAEKPGLVKLDYGLRQLRFAPTSDALYATLEDGTVRRFDMSGQATEIDRGKGIAMGLAISADGKLLAAGFSDGSVRLTDLTTREHREIARHATGVPALAFSEDGARLASGGHDHQIRVVRLSDGRTSTIDAGGSGVAKVRFSNDGKTLFWFSTLESTVRRWSVEREERLPPISGHGGELTQFWISGTGKRSLTLAGDESPQLCELESGRCRLLAGHGASVRIGAFAPGDRSIVTFDSTGTVRAWPDDLPESLPELRAWVDAATPDRIE